MSQCILKNLVTVLYGFVFLPQDCCVDLIYIFSIANDLAAKAFFVKYKTKSILI